MDTARVEKLIAQSEGLTLEFKEASGGLPESLFESVCAFLNREGGTIGLGVSDDGSISGIAEETRWVEEIGSGVVNVSRYLPIYTSGAKPEFSDGNMFCAVIPLPVYAETTQKTTQKSLQEQILDAIRENPNITRIALAKKLGKSPNTIKENLAKLKVKERLRRVGPDKGGYWEVTDENS